MATKKPDPERWLALHVYADKRVLFWGYPENPWPNGKPNKKFRVGTITITWFLSKAKYNTLNQL